MSVSRYFDQTLHLLFLAVLSIFLVVILLLLLKGLRRLLGWLWLWQQPTVLLQMTPPFDHGKSLGGSTTQLFSVLHSLTSLRSRWDRFMNRPIVISLELVSSRAGGIRYLARVPAKDEAVIKQLLSAHLPTMEFAVVKDYLESSQTKVTRVIELKQTGHYAYPLSSQDANHLNDPMAFLAGMMTKLGTSELLVFQLIMSPLSGSKTYRLANRLSRSKSTTLSSRPGQLASSLLLKLLHLLAAILRAFAEVVGEIVSGNHPPPSQANKSGQGHLPSPSSKRLLESMQTKLVQPCFRVNLRLLSQSDDQAKSQELLKGLLAAFTLFKSPGHQAIKPRSQLVRAGGYSLLKFRRHLPDILDSGSSIFSPAELADIYHFPYARQETENLVTGLGHPLPAPLSLKGSTPLDVIVGRNDHQGQLTPIGLTTSERERHVYIIGGTGNGKTTLMRYAIVQDFYSGKGVAVIDPHGDLAESLLGHIPDKRLNDVIYFNPDDLTKPIGLNLLELPSGLSGDALLREQDLVTESIVAIFRKFFSDSDWGGHRIEYILRNTIHTAFQTPDPTLRTLYRLLTDPSFRYKTINTLKDEDLVNFWREEFAKAGSFQRVKMASGVTTKLGRFLRSITVSRVIDQPKSTINFDDILDSGKILICNFSKGTLGEDTSTLFGATVLAKLQLAALRRSGQAVAKRRPFYLYVDEFQNFSTKAFVDMLSEARKYRLYLTMAEQSTAQQAELRLVNVILANVGTIICFRSGSQADEQLLLPLFSPWLKASDLANLASFNFYIKLAATKPEAPLSGETILLEDPLNTKTMKRVKQASARGYGQKKPSR